ncbi:aminotransferase class IV [Legionella bononiensis]|uniref:branched-chain-amino-acid transaminase n=1 Tax=Legionella bononiensis TaxID=2793102 RepID=A0ABS1W6H6_9GAMM|nr:aminotransferase class IV [Legionella bononiensis]MBL7478371.1 aminotransferase class IV [Legionella bononiensis]MBL7524968.1 aminotransferase class IV [Legionella bononiensis]MBL7561265.1 aminotransferase class IV [Legionella bononiensis]
MHTRVLIDKGDVTPVFGIDDRIFLGEGLFETIKVDSSKPCFAALHWQRLSHSARQLGIPFDLSLDDWCEHLIQQIRRDNLYHGGIKAILSGGSAPRGLAERGQVSQLIFQTFNYHILNHPIRLISTSWLRDAANPIYQLKTVNYLEAILARRQALTLGADDALFFNQQHFATETTCANLFLIKDNQLITPPQEHGVLPGITRSRIFSLCQEHNISCIEKGVTKVMIEEADAVFISNSLQGIRAVLAVDQVIFEVAHPLIEQLISLLSFDELNNTKKQNSYAGE